MERIVPRAICGEEGSLFTVRIRDLDRVIGLQGLWETDKDKHDNVTCEQSWGETWERQACLLCWSLFKKLYVLSLGKSGSTADEQNHSVLC